MQRRIYLVVVIFPLLSFVSQGETPHESFFHLSLKEIVNLPITTATGLEQPLTKAPATASVITAK